MSTQSDCYDNTAARPQCNVAKNIGVGSNTFRIAVTALAVMAVAAGIYVWYQANPDTTIQTSNRNRTTQPSSAPVPASVTQPAPVTPAPSTPAPSATPSGS